MQSRRVLVYRNELLPPSETFVLSQARALRRFQPLFAGLERVRGGLDLTTHPVITLCRSEAWHEKAKRRIFLRTGRSQKLTAVVAKQNSQVVHAHFAIDACAVLPVAKELRVPLIVTLHGYDVSCTDEFLKVWPTTRTYLRRKEELWEYATLFVCVSESVRRRALVRGFPQQKLWVHRIGVELCSKKQREEKRDPRLALFVGRLVEKKGCIHLIRAMSGVQKAIPEARLAIVGDGPLRRALEHEAALHSSNIVFLGHQSHAIVRQWMRRASVLVAPSVPASSGDCEGLPTVLCEAQAEGLPVVAFATEGVTEALPADRRNSLPRAGDVSGLSQEIIRFMEDDRIWQQISDAGKYYAGLHFDLAAQTHLLENKYEEVIARGHA
ncbi:glycosyltransferase [Alloacidobacterium dinghuense]|uniref:Glycosyltransferase n=1 Tax=Alloacidobacterium dinghuense TaxID=2763107 RepID=A0A7G8BJI1_9BACT|nr:glycosyltransferase [Alloacidobacterium dinghuense]QNI32701.1 glycosyltransferase [Alloacidobacterium dinghuense]